MNLIDLSYLLNLILNDEHSEAEKVVKHLNLGNYSIAKAWIIGVYNTLPATLQEFLKSAENPQARKNMKNYTKICSYFSLEFYA